MIGLVLLALPLLFLVIAIIHLSVFLYKLRNPTITPIQHVTFSVDIISELAMDVKSQKILLINKEMRYGQEEIENIMNRIYVKEQMQAKILPYNFNIPSEARNQVLPLRNAKKFPILLDNQELPLEFTKRIYSLKDKDKEELLCVQN